MNMKFHVFCLTALGSAASLLAPAEVHAGNIGYVTGQTCSGPGDKAAAITAAGHTPVGLASISPATLAGLDGLVWESCGGYAANADIASAVNAGMGLIISDWIPNASTGSQLPGAPAISYNNYNCFSEIDLPPTSPAISGPGGTLTNASMDGGNCSAHGSTPVASLPVGVQVLTTTNDPAQAVSLMYSYGAGTVVYAPLPWSWFLPGGTGASNPAAPGIAAFMINGVALSAGTAGPVTTCASSGYTGTQLTWCQNICEKGYTGATLNMWIRRWLGRWHDLPYCAAAPQPTLN